MNRRELLQTIAATLPAGATGRIEAKPTAGDLIVIQSSNPYLTAEERDHIATVVRQAFGNEPQPTVLVLNPDMSLRVERGIARVILPTAP